MHETSCYKSNTWKYGVCNKFSKQRNQKSEVMYLKVQKVLQDSVAPSTFYKSVISKLYWSPVSLPLPPLYPVILKSPGKCHQAECLTLSLGLYGPVIVCKLCSCHSISPTSHTHNMWQCCTYTRGLGLMSSDKPLTVDAITHKHPTLPMAIGEIQPK